MSRAERLALSAVAKLLTHPANVIEAQQIVSAMLEYPKIDHNAKTDRRQPEDEPELFLTPCQCETPDCDRFIIAMLRPVIKPLEGTNELVSMVYFPKGMAHDLVSQVRQLAAERKGRRK